MFLLFKKSNIFDFWYCESIMLPRIQMTLTIEKHTKDTKSIRINSSKITIHTYRIVLYCPGFIVCPNKWRLDSSNELYKRKGMK